MPLISGRMFDTGGVAGVFGMIAVMYAIFTACIQLAPETYGHRLDETAAEPELGSGTAPSHA
jgi:putative MFS transporter